MCNFNSLDTESKSFIHLFMKKAAENIGGENFLLSLIEAMRSKKPNPLILKEKKVSSNHSSIEWNKIIFKDKVDLIRELLLYHTDTTNATNILNLESAKKKKKVLNLIRTFTSVEFFVTPQNKNDGMGFSFKAFDEKSSDEAIINPIFIAMFFCSAEFTKKALKYEIQG